MSWWLAHPRIFVRTPLIENPVAAEKCTVRTPNVVVSSSDDPSGAASAPPGVSVVVSV